MGVTLLQRFFAAYADLKPQDPAETGWVESIVRVGGAASLTFQWLVCSSLQSIAFPYLAPTAKVLRIMGAEIHTVRAATLPAAPVQHTVYADGLMRNLKVIILPLLYKQKLPVEELKVALEKALVLHPSFAGRMAQDKASGLHFKLNNAGIALHTSTSPDHLEDLLPHDADSWFVETDVRSAFGGHLQFASGTMLDKDAPPARIAVVHLACGGTLLIVAASHVLGDLRTTRSFMEHWVAAYNGQQLPDKPVPHIHELLDEIARDRHTPEGPEGRSELIPLPPDFNEADIAKQYFTMLKEAGGITVLHLHVPKSRLRQLKEKANEDIKGLQNQGLALSDAWVSTSDALLARIWQVVSTLPVRQGEAFSVSVAVDVRKRLRPPISEHVAGNMIKTALPDAVPDAAHQPLGRLALALRGAILRAPADYVATVKFAKAHRASEANNDMTYASVQGPHNVFSSGTGMVPCTNWDLDYEALAFGAGPSSQPVWLSMSKIDSIGLPNVVVVTKVPPGSHLGEKGGCLVSIWITKNNAKALLKQQEVV